MKNITIKKIKGCNDLLKTQASVSHIKTLITEPCNIYDADGNLIIHYDYIPKNINQNILNELQGIKFSHSTRKSGLATESVIFGFSPRDYVKGLCCRISLWRKTQQNLHDKFCFYAQEFDKLYANLFSEIHKKHNEVLNKEIKSFYRIPKTTYTSGIINKSNGLLYHTDNGNYKGYRSCMMYHEFGDVRGGELSFPEYEIGFKFQHNTYIFFDGATLIHGVCPILKGVNSQRYTTVFYTLEGLRQGLEPVEEQRLFIEKNNTKFLGKK